MIVRGSLVAAVAALLVAPAVAHACSVCLCGDNHAANLGLDTPVVGQWRLGLEQRVSSKSNGVEGEPLSTESSRDSRTTLALSYSPTMRFSYGLNVPLVDRRIEITNRPVTTTSLQFGDIEAQARADVWVHRTHGVFSATRVLAGVTLPTGSNNLMKTHNPNADSTGSMPSPGVWDLVPAHESTGDRYDEHAQPGTGAWAGTLGLAQLWSTPATWLYGSVAYRVLTTNSHDYRYGASWLLTVEGGRRLGTAVSAVMGVAARTTQQDETGDAAEPLLVDSGGKVAFVTPGVQAKIGTDWIARAQVFVPAWSDLNGTQDEKTNVIVRLTYTK